MDRGDSPLSVTWQGDPPPAPRDEITLPYLQSIAVIYFGVTAKRDRWKNLEGSLASSLHTGGHRLTEILPPLPSLLALVA